MNKILAISLLLICSCQKKIGFSLTGTYMAKPNTVLTTYYKLLGYRVLASSKLKLYVDSTFVFSECTNRDSVFGSWSVNEDRVILTPNTYSKWSDFYPSDFKIRNQTLFSNQKCGSGNIIRILEGSVLR